MNWRERLRPQPRVLVLLTVIWVLLWGDLSLLTILGGLVLAWLISTVLWLPPAGFTGRFHPWRILVLAVAQLRDLAVASFLVAAVAFRPRVVLRPGIVRVDLRSDHDLYQVAVSQLISVVPGTLVVETTRHPRRLYLHVFHLPDEQAVARERDAALAIERRLVRAFGNADDIEAVRP